MKKGFTLIELLAVIVILAIIALIATPIVLNIIANTKENAQLRSAEMYLDAVEQSVALEKMTNTTFKPNTCKIEDKKLYCNESEEELKVEVDGEKPDSGNITFTEGKIDQVTLTYTNGKTVVKNDKGSLEYGEVVLAAGLYDADGNMIASWDTLVTTYGFDITANGIAGAPQTVQPGNTATRIFTNTDLSNGVKLVVKDGITNIGDAQFKYLTTIKEVVLPESVKSIGSHAFYMSNITKINLDNVESISVYAFENANLESITLSDKLTSIPEAAFTNNEFVNVEIPSSVTSVASNAFSNCKNLKTIYIPASISGKNITASSVVMGSSTELKVYCEANFSYGTWYYAVPGPDNPQTYAQEFLGVTREEYRALITG